MNTSRRVSRIVPPSYDLSVEYNVIKDGQKVKSGQHPSGWCDISNGKVGMAIGVRDFWREHPKEVQYRDGRMGLYIWPDHGKKTMDLRRRYKEVRGAGSKRGGTWGKAARRVFNQAGSAVGIAKTTELFFYFHKGDQEDAAVDTTFRGFQDPLMPFVSGEWNCATGVFGALHAYDMKDFPKTENYIDLGFAWILNSGHEYHWYGMFDYGDHLIEYESINWELEVPANSLLYQNWGYSGWTQEGYRLGQWMFLQYFRSGRYFYYREAENWLRHHRDVDCVFLDKPDDGQRPIDNKGGNRLGGGHRHDQQHWGTYMTSYALPQIATAHHYCLTGDGRDLDVMPLYANWIIKHNQDSKTGLYSAAYTGLILGDDNLLKQGMERREEPMNGYGRGIYDSGMSLMLLDAHFDGKNGTREELKRWAEIKGEEVNFIRAYLFSKGEKKFAAQIRQDVEKLFPAKSVRAQYFGWASRKPKDFRDAFSPEIMPKGLMTFPLRLIEKLQFDSPNGMGNNPSRNSYSAQLMFSMDACGGKEP